MPSMSDDAIVHFNDNYDVYKLAKDSDRETSIKGFIRNYVIVLRGYGTIEADAMSLPEAILTSDVMSDNLDKLRSGKSTTTPKDVMQ